MTHIVRRLPLAVGIVALATVTPACGTTRESSSSATSEAHTTPGAARTVEIVMEDIRFDQTTLTVTAGETIEFRFVNNGKIPHDAFVGDADAQTEHEADMAHMEHMGGHSMDETAITVEPGDSGELSYTFEHPGTFEVGCHQPGHYAAGMKIDVTVE
ncbi:MAG: plastocyanin/azurin family copper-binding protein [Ilumatobacteraceae bacterium]